jgi:ribosome-interacting GTPase 1
MKEIRVEESMQITKNNDDTKYLLLYKHYKLAMLQEEAEVSNHRISFHHGTLLTHD